MFLKEFSQSRDISLRIDEVVVLKLLAEWQYSEGYVARPSNHFQICEKFGLQIPFNTGIASSVRFLGVGVSIPDQSQLVGLGGRREGRFRS